MIDRRTATVFALRLLGCYALSAVFTAAMVYVMRRAITVQPFALMVVPIGIVIGLVPLLLWYRRDAYPIGILYPISAFYFLRKGAAFVDAWLNSR